jgi:hypothetical protein
MAGSKELGSAGFRQLSGFQMIERLNLSNPFNPFLFSRALLDDYKHQRCNYFYLRQLFGGLKGVKRFNYLLRSRVLFL